MTAEKRRDELSFDHKLARPTDGWTGLLNDEKKGVELTWTGIELSWEATHSLGPTIS